MADVSSPSLNKLWLWCIMGTPQLGAIHGRLSIVGSRPKVNCNASPFIAVSMHCNASSFDECHFDTTRFSPCRDKDILTFWSFARRKRRTLPGQGLPSKQIWRARLQFDLPPFGWLTAGSKFFTSSGTVTSFTIVCPACKCFAVLACGPRPSICAASYNSRERFCPAFSAAGADSVTPVRTIPLSSR